MLAEVLECCSIKVSTGNETRRYIDCFKTKTIKEKQADGSVVTKKNFFKRKFEDGREIKKEILLLALCPNCKHYILKYLWYAKASDRFYDWAESKVIKGKKADEIFNRRADDYEFYDIPDPEANKKRCGLAAAMRKEV